MKPSLREGAHVPESRLVWSRSSPVLDELPASVVPWGLELLVWLCRSDGPAALVQVDAVFAPAFKSSQLFESSFLHASVQRLR